MNLFDELESGDSRKSNGALSLSEHFKHGYLLVVDDDAGLRKTLKNMLRELEINDVVEADDGDTALKILKNSNKLCLFVLLDWLMPRMSGLEVVREIRAHDDICNVPVLMVSAVVDQAQIIRAGEEGISGYLTKPFVRSSIESKIRGVLQARMNPPDHVRLILAAESRLKVGDYERAIEMFEESLIIKQTARAMVYAGDVHQMLRRVENAFGMYSRAMSSNPRFLRAYSKAADLHEKQGNLDDAIGLLKKASEISPNNPERHASIGKLHLKKGEDVEAIEAFNRSIKIDPAIGPDIAMELLKIEKPELAESFFRKNLVTATAQSAYLHNMIGISLRRQGKWREAIVEYEKAIGLDPGDENIYYNLGKAYLEGRDRESAIKYFNMALRLNPDCAEFRDILADLGRGDDRNFVLRHSDVKQPFDRD